MINKTAWILFFAVTASLFIFYLVSSKIHYGGDIIEYFGISESLINHHGIDLQERDKTNLVNRLGSGYFDNPEYYIPGRDGHQYAVHFPLYSLMNVPTRLLLRSLHQDEYKTFRLTNIFILTIVGFVVLKYFLKFGTQRFVFVLSLFLSPFLWYLVWPGPEIFSLSLIFLSLFFFMSGKKEHSLWATLLATVASYQSQPLIVIPIGYVIYYLVHTYLPIPKTTKQYEIKTIVRDIVLLFLFFILLLAPNIFYYLLFGTFSSYAKLSGVGIANITLRKFVELFFDPNIGLFFYMPVLFLEGCIAFLFRLKENSKSRIVFFISITVSILYLTNTNWNNGTAGFGPTRYVLPLVPILLYFFVTAVNIKKFLKREIFVMIFFVATQLFILSFNGNLMPDLENTVRLTPFAKLVLNHFPSLYNPTPEIFVERVSEKEGGIWDTTIYKNNGVCKKAYILLMGEGRLIAECGYIPDQYTTRRVNYYRIYTLDGLYVNY